MANSSSDEDVETLLLLALHQRRKRKKTPKRFWVRSVFTQRRRCGAYSTLIQEMRLSDPELHLKPGLQYDARVSVTY